MARQAGKDRGITQRKGRKGWWVRLYEHGRQRWFRCDTKSQAKALYGRLKADIREGTFSRRNSLPEKTLPFGPGSIATSKALSTATSKAKYAMDGAGPCLLEVASSPRLRSTISDAFKPKCAPR